MKTIDFSYFIERYISGEMSTSEKEWFLKELDGNEKLCTELHLRQHTEDVLKGKDIISLRNRLNGIEKRREMIITGKRSMMQANLKFVAVITGIILIGTITMYTGRNLSNDEIMNRYYKKYEPPTATRSGQSETNADFTLAMEFYNTQNYGQAAILFNKIVESNPKDMQSTLLNGIANFENNKYPEAKRSFGFVIENNNNLYIDQAEWYLALCYVKTGEREKAIRQFEMIIDGDGIFRKDAKKVIRKLK